MTRPLPRPLKRRVPSKSKAKANRPPCCPRKSASARVTACGFQARAPHPMARPRDNYLRPEEREPDPRDTREGAWTKLQLLRMDERFAQALARAPEAPQKLVIAPHKG